jgi:hypothetical protein
MDVSGIEKREKSSGGTANEEDVAVEAREEEYGEGGEGEGSWCVRRRCFRAVRCSFSTMQARTASALVRAAEVEESRRVKRRGRRRDGERLIKSARNAIAADEAELGRSTMG